MSLFRNISGRRSEDIATEVIARLLSRDGPHVPFQKLFFGRVLGMTLSSDQWEWGTGFTSFINLKDLGSGI
jgi:hypothetical protein